MIVVFAALRVFSDSLLLTSSYKCRESISVSIKFALRHVDLKVLSKVIGEKVPVSNPRIVSNPVSKFNPALVPILKSYVGN